MGRGKLNLIIHANLWKIFALLCFVATINAKAAVLVKNKQWQKDAVLNVVFLDGEPRLQQMVIDTAPQWLNNTNLSFHFFSDLKTAPKLTHIRISFALHSGSQLGDHHDYESKYPTMNLFGLAFEPISDTSAQRLILHEFGHALGFEHEYRNSYWPYGKKAINQIIVDCYPKMEQIGYSRLAAIERCKKINAPISSNLAYLTAYDERSIMNYPMSFKSFDGSKKQIKPAFNLSLLDRYAMQRWYAH